MITLSGPKVPARGIQSGWMLAAGSAVLALAAAGLYHIGLRTWEIYVVPAGLLALGLILRQPKIFFLVLAALPFILSEVSNDELFTPVRSPFFSSKLLGLINLYDLGFLLILGIWLSQRLRKGLRFSDSLDVPLLGFLAVSFLSLVRGLLFNSDEMRLIFFELININRFVLVYFLAKDYLRAEQDQKRLFAVWMACAVAVGAYGLLRFTQGAGVDIYGQGQKLIFYDLGFNTLFMAAFLLLLGVIGSRHSPKRLGMVFLALLPAAFSLIFSFRRGIWMGILAGWLILLLLDEPQDRVRLVLRTAVLVFAVYLFIGFLKPFVPRLSQSLEYGAERFESISDTKQDSSNLYRLIDMENAWEAIKQQPLLGLGLGGYYKIYFGSETHHAYTVAKLNNVSHNSYLFLWMKMGIFSIGFFLWAILNALWRAGQRLRKPLPGFRRQTLVFAVAGLIGILVVQFTNPLFLYAGGAVFLGIFLALATQQPGEPEAVKALP